MNILVTGATGFLGNALVPLLVSDGHKVRVVARGGAPEAAALGCEVVQGDLTHPETAQKALSGIDALYHLAGRVSRDPKDARLMYDLHVEGTRKLFEQALAAKVKRVVLASTSGAIGVSRERRVATEDDDYPIETVGKWPYYLSKIYEEKLALEFVKRGLPVVVLNPSLLLGPGDARLSSTQDVYRFLQQRIPAMPRGGISFVDVRDAALAFRAALTKGNVGERHLLGAVNWEFTEFFARLSRIAHVPGPTLRLPSPVKVAAAHLLEKWAKKNDREPDLPASDVEMGECWFFIDSSKAERVLGFAPRDPNETLRETVKYVQKHFLEPGHEARA
ncbi:MAG: NAD-dependent epimerase/dehydratase family protein [Deltaproteobacteria bacterium]|nr:NAD-dependent epimerase/dehydratase family protein [Deltaproteobacteria bacterium]